MCSYIRKSETKITPDYEEHIANSDTKINLDYNELNIPKITPQN